MQLAMTFRCVCLVVGVASLLAGCGDDGAATRGDDTHELDASGEVEIDDSSSPELMPEASDDDGDGHTAPRDDTSAGPSDDTSLDETTTPDTDQPEADLPESDLPSGDDAALPTPGFGVITGSCGFVADELDNPEPSLWHNRIDFGDDPYDDADIAHLSDGAREILADGNAGGSSILSEVFAFEILARCEGATLLKTENEIVYDVAAKITDMIVGIDGHKVGANPTRAIGFPFDAPYSVEQARTVLEKKLGDINSSSAAVSEADRWVKQVLTVFAYADDHAARVEEAWHAIDPSLRADTIVVVTVTDGADRFIYSND